MRINGLERIENLLKSIEESLGHIPNRGAVGGFVLSIMEDTKEALATIRAIRNDDTLFSVDSTLISKKLLGQSMYSLTTPEAKLIKFMLSVDTERKIDTIKLYRSFTDIGLKEAKDAVEKCMADGTSIEIQATPQKALTMAASCFFNDIKYKVEVVLVGADE